MIDSSRLVKRCLGLLFFTSHRKELVKERAKAILDNVTAGAFMLEFAVELVDFLGGELAVGMKVLQHQLGARPNQGASIQQPQGGLLAAAPAGRKLNQLVLVIHGAHRLQHRGLHGTTLAAFHEEIRRTYCQQGDNYTYRTKMLGLH